jgi:endonuclease/exonuclease/phosphatase (EEP) superfamily protein YafD
MGLTTAIAVGASLRMPAQGLGRTRQASTGRYMALAVLALANIGLMLVIGGIGTMADVIAPFTGHLMGFGLAASVALTVRGRMSVLAAGIAATLLAHAGLGWARCCEAPKDGPSLARVKSAAPRPNLTVLNLNTWHARGDIGRIEQYLATAPADVVVLSEFDPGGSPLIASLREIYPYNVACTSEPPCSLALLSRVPLEASGSARIAEGEPSFVWARINPGEQGPTTIIGTQLNRPSGNPWRHEVQMRELAQFIRRIDGPLVLAGSLNTSPWSQSFRTLRLATGLNPAGKLIPSWPAWPIALPQVALDHIFVSPELAVSAAGTGPAVGSDHLPVWAQIERQPLAAYPERARRAPRSRLAAAGAHLGGELLGDLGGEHGGARDLSR